MTRWLSVNYRCAFLPIAGCIKLALPYLFAVRTAWRRLGAFGQGCISSVHHVRNHADIPPWDIHPLEEGSLEEAGRTAVDHWHKGRGEEGSRVGTGHRSDREEGEEDNPPLVGEVVIDSELGHHSSLVVGFGHGSRIRRGEDYSREEDHGGRSHPREGGTDVVPESGIDHGRERERQAERRQHIGRAVP